jgi:malonyl-CoA/methylmalonyl-CoA synthetase
VVQPAGRFDADAVRDEMRRELAAFKVPKQIIVLDELPRNTMGKIQKKLLRERYADLFA